jgi:hypothetical protein
MMPVDAERRVCAVCARGLQRLMDRQTGKQEYLHPVDMVLMEQDDHIPVPVMPDEISAETRCDFCHWRNPQWVIPVRNFEYGYWKRIGLPLDGESVGSWAACDTCADLVNRGLWSNLLRRVTEAYRQVTAEMELGKGWQDKESNEFVEASMRSMYRQLRKNIVGSPRHLNG